MEGEAEAEVGKGNNVAGKPGNETGKGREGRGREGLKLERSKEGFQFRFAFARHTRRRNNKEAAEKELRKMRATMRPMRPTGNEKMMAGLPASPRQSMDAYGFT